MNHSRRKSAGGALIEALVSILIFSFAALGLLGVQAASTKHAADANYRAQAAYLTNQIISRMWVDRGDLDNYAHRTGGATCAFTGGAAAAPAVATWLSNVGDLLPGFASATSAQITVASPTATTRQIKVTLCWQTPQDAGPRNFSSTTVINQ